MTPNPSMHRTAHRRGFAPAVVAGYLDSLGLSQMDRRELERMWAVTAKHLSAARAQLPEVLLQVLMAQQSAASMSVCGTTKWSWRSMNLKTWGLRMPRQRTFGGTSSSRPRAWNFRSVPQISSGESETHEA